MGLESTNIKDSEGAALYILHTGSVLAGRQLEHMASEIQQRTGHQVHMLDVHAQDGEKVRDFYDINVSDLPVVLIVRDDDTLTNIWKHNEIPTTDVIAHALRQVSGG